MLFTAHFFLFVFFLFIYLFIYLFFFLVLFSFRIFSTVDEIFQNSQSTLNPVVYDF